MSELSDAVRAFVAEQLGVSSGRLSSETTLFGDLGVDGDDAVDLMSAFGERFGVDLSEFDRQAYFGSEGWSPVALYLGLAGLMRGGSPEARAGLKPVSIGCLVKSARIGQWQCGA